MSFLWRWLRRLVTALALLAILLAAPIAYVELACQGDASPDTYTALLPPEHHRPEARTLMTYPEWHIVHAYDDYARVIADGDPHQFAYLRAIRGFWSSLCALTRASARHGGVDGGTRQMVYVIGTSFSLELALKAAYEETLGRLATLLRPNRARADDLSAAQARAYGEFLQQTPWYRWDFRADAAALSAIPAKSLRDHERALALGLEYRAKAAYAGVIEDAVASVGADAQRLRLILRDVETARLAAIDDVRLIATDPQGITIETPRYRALTHILAALAADGANFVEVAGNDDILLTALSTRATHDDALHSFPRQGHGDHRHLLLVRIADLGATLRALDGQGLKLEHIHDY